MYIWIRNAHNECCTVLYSVEYTYSDRTVQYMRMCNAAGSSRRASPSHRRRSSRAGSVSWRSSVCGGSLLRRRGSGRWASCRRRARCRHVNSSERIALCQCRQHSHLYSAALCGRAAHVHRQRARRRQGAQRRRGALRRGRATRRVTAARRFRRTRRYSFIHTKRTINCELTSSPMY